MLRGNEYIINAKKVKLIMRIIANIIFLTDVKASY